MLITNIKNKMLEENISYIYVFSTNEQLNEIAKKEFNTEIKTETLYKLEKENDKVELKEIPLD